MSDNTKAMSHQEWEAMSPAEREASAASWFEFQDARDGAGQLAALKEGGRNRERLQRGEVTDAELEQELTTTSPRSAWSRTRAGMP